MPHTVVEYFGCDESGNDCGYCKKCSTSVAHGMWAHALTCQDYQDLLDRGWRRSGKYCYKPVMAKTCCPQYTIRLDVTGIKLSKSQKKVIKTFNKYIRTGVKPAKNCQQDGDDKEKNEPQEVEAMSEGNTEEEIGHVSLEMPATISPKLQGNVHTLKSAVKGPDPEKPECRKAKEIRKELKAKRHEGLTVPENPTKSKWQEKNRGKSLEDWIEDIPTDAKVKLKVTLVRCCPESSEFKKTYKQEFEVYKKYQVAIHKDKPDEVNERQFRRFLCEGPLTPVTVDGNETIVPSCGFGAFHQLHFLDDRLIAVGVLDILPNSVSSKYFFYDPEFQFLSLGTYSALREIYFIRSLQRQCTQLKYYYMGFYIQTCPKMRYKGKFTPSYLLCPESYRWIPIENCVEKLDKNKYSRLEEDESITAEEYTLNKTLILYETQFMPFEIYFALLNDPEEKTENKEVVEEYTRLTGKASQSMLLYRN